jgi:hypothetical protein
MKRILLLLFLSSSLFAQTGIGTTTPNASAKLDVYSTNKGFLPPRVTLTSTSDASTIASPAEGLLVYNLGSVGLQAGYYYWNGANWATIATATSAGNGVTSTDMVKLYGKAYSTASGDIAHANGHTFTVPVSGRYSFDFSSSGYLNQALMTITFKVRQGTTDLGTDFFTTANNNVHVVFEGKVEVNLQAGVSYNVFVTTTGSRDGGDYDRVYYKQVAGNLPVTGQSVDYIQASLSTNQALSSAGNIIFNSSSGAGITLTNGGFNLKANKTYKLEAALGGTSGGYAYYAWVDNGNVILPGGSVGTVMKAGSAYTDAPQGKAVVYYTPTTNSTVYLRVYSLSGTLTAYAPSIATNYSSSWATIQQVGSSAFVNPWVLAGNDVYNTTGEVGIGTNTPAATAALDVSSTTKGVLIPRMTAAQKSAISSPSNGLLIFQTDAPAGFYHYNGSAWISISNPGTTTRFLPHSNNFAHFAGLQSLSSLASGSYVALNNSDLVIDVPSGYSSNKVVIKWDTWGDVATSGAANGSLRYLIKQTGTSSNTYNSVAMNGWATSGTSGTRFATPVTYILTDLAPGTYTFKLEISREGELGTVSSINNYQVSGSVQVFVK